MGIANQYRPMDQLAPAPSYHEDQRKAMNQQQQTHEYFRQSASDWQLKASTSDYNVVTSRNRYVLSLLENISGVGRFLDVGCGTGQLVLDAARRGFKAVGVDFAEEMIAQCHANRTKAAVEACFLHGSIFDIELPDANYDVISAQGFIEYFSPDEMERFFAICQKLLRPQGALLVFSRNRLFNVVSFNDFTRLEMQLGVLDALIAEATDLQQAATIQDAWRALKNYEICHPHPDRHPMTGIGVDVRYQYSPGELIGRLRRYGFEPASLFPLHFHGLPAVSRAKQPELHGQLADLIDKLTIPSDRHRIVPYSSSFLLDVRKLT